MSIQYLGDAYGHIYQMVEYDNHCEDNTGPVLWFDIIQPIVAIGLFALMRPFPAWRSAPPGSPHPRCLRSEARRTNCSAAGA